MRTPNRLSTGKNPRMNKPLKRIAAVLVILLAAGAMVSCEKEPDAVPRYPSRVAAESADNSAGARFILTLEELDSLLESEFKALGRRGNELDPKKGWSVLMDGLVDDNGVGYTSYVRQMKDAVLTAAVENDSKKLINVGCGCSPGALSDERRDSFVTITAVLAGCVGGYRESDLAFLKKMTEDFLNKKESPLHYEGLLFTRSEDEESIVVILSPSDAKAFQN